MSKGTWDIIHSKYVASAVRADQYPRDKMIEAAFIGRIMDALTESVPVEE